MTTSSDTGFQLYDHDSKRSLMRTLAVSVRDSQDLGFLKRGVRGRAVSHNLNLGLSKTTLRSLYYKSFQGL